MTAYSRLAFGMMRLGRSSRAPSLKPYLMPTPAIRRRTCEAPPLRKWRGKFANDRDNLLIIPPSQHLQAGSLQAPGLVARSTRISNRLLNVSGRCRPPLAGTRPKGTSTASRPRTPQGQRTRPPPDVGVVVP